MAISVGKMISVTRYYFFPLTNISQTALLYVVPMCLIAFGGAVCIARSARLVWCIPFVALLVLWRVTHGRVPLVSAIMLAVYAAIWLPSGALWLDIGYEEFIQVGGTEDITIQLVGLMILLLLTALCAGIALFADSLRRQKA